MPGKIHLLDERTKNLIAAGEVIERPASVVKELLENALDAGARRISVDLEGAGNRLVRVIDDGAGMEREDAELAFCRHATSKISAADDLREIATLGFRGEALPSIASVSRFELETCTRDNPCGTRIVVEGDKTLEIADISRAPGTTACVRNLFFNVPARRKFLKSDQTELRHIIRTVTSMAVAQIETGFKLTHEGREIFSVPPSASVAERIEGLFGGQRPGRLLPIYLERGEFVIGGLVSAPDSVSRARGDQYMFINRRPFACRSLAHAVRQGFQGAVADTAQVSFYVFLTLPAREVDVNVHPAKLEVRFRDEGLVYSMVHKAVQDGLGQKGAASGYDKIPGGKLVGLSRPGHGARVAEAGHAVLAGKKAGFQTSFLMPLEPGKAALAVRKAAFGLTGRESPKDPGPKVTEPDPGLKAQAPGAESRAYDIAEALPWMWQLHNRYVFVETKDGFLMIDQHAAHERVLYEQIMKNFNEGGLGRQRLLFPITLELSPEEYSAALEFRGLFEKAGFEIEEFGGRGIVVRSVPLLGQLGGPEDYFRDLLDEIVREGQGSTGTRHQILARSLACKAAIRSGQSLSAKEMNELIDQLFATDLPYADVHGRNVIVHLSLEEIDKRFGRR